MSHFPAFINMKNKKVLLVGAGHIAFNKLNSLLEFTTNITIISNEFSDEINKVIKKNSLSFNQRDYEAGDIKGFDIVVVATNSYELQKSIYKESRELNCFFNCVDFPELCDFTFASYIKEGDLTIAISTSGNSPAVSKQLRIYIEKLIPKNISTFLNEMKEYRKIMPKGKERMKFLEQKAKDYFNSLK